MQNILHQITPGEKHYNPNYQPGPYKPSKSK
jgi:hypothetical protein